MTDWERRTPEQRVRRREQRRKRWAEKMLDPVFVARKRAASRAWKFANPEKVRQWEKERINRQLPEYRQKKAKYMKRRRETDPNFKLRENLRRRLRFAIRGFGKTARTLELLGCTIFELRAYLEARFRPGMTWENYGPVWHVDHKRPCAGFDLTDVAQQRVCFHYSNLQPLFAEENLRKRAKPWV